MLAFLFVLISAPVHAGEPIVRTLPAGMPALEIDNPKGIIEVHFDPDATESTLTATPIFWSAGCELSFSGDAAMARVEVQKDGERAASGCRTRIDLVLAGDTALHLQGTKGRVIVNETRGPLDIDLQRGKIVLGKVYGPTDVTLVTGKVTGSPVSDELHIAVDRGRIHLDDLRVPVYAEVGVGGIQLAYSIALEGTATAHVGVGRVRASFPYGTLLDRHTTAKFGSVKSEIPHRTTSRTRFEASANLGVVDVDTSFEDEEDEAVATN
jgi:hypothetical protein